MVWYKSDYDCNGCELPSEQATPPTLARKVWPIRLHEEEIVKHLKSVCVKELCVSGWYTLAMDLNMSIIDDDYELDRILESMNLDKYELID